MSDLWILFWSFARIGCFTFGGGYAMLPMLQKEIVEKLAWATEAEIMDYFAIGQCTPGVIAVNTATFIGYKRKGFVGGIVATLGMIFPSIVIITAIASTLSHFSNLPVVQHAFSGIRIIVTALVLKIVLTMYQSAVKDRVTFILFILTLFLGLILSLSPIYFIVSAALIGITHQKLGGFKSL